MKNVICTIQLLLLMSLVLIFSFQPFYVMPVYIFQWNENQGFYRKVQTVGPHLNFFFFFGNDFNLALLKHECENCQVRLYSFMIFSSYPWVTRLILAGSWGRTAELLENYQPFMSFTLIPSFGPFQPSYSCAPTCLGSFSIRRTPPPRLLPNSLHSRTSEVHLQI